MPLPAVPTIESLVTDDRRPTLSGTYDSAAATGFTVAVNGVTYTLGTDPQLTHVGDDWSLTIDRPLPLGTLTATATATNGSGSVETTQPITLTAAVNEWRGDAEATPAVIQITITLAVSQSNYSIRIGQGIYTYRSHVGESVNAIALGLAAQLAAARGFSVVSSGGTIILTSQTPGVPIPGPIRSEPVPGSFVEQVRAGQYAVPQQVQLTLPGTTTGGTWSLGLAVAGGAVETASALPASITPDALQTAVEGLYAGAAVAVQLLSTAPRTYLLTLGGTLAGQACAVVASGDGLTGNAACTIRTIQTAGANGPAVWMIATRGTITGTDVKVTINGVTHQAQPGNITTAAWWNARLTAPVQNLRSDSVIVPTDGTPLLLIAFALQSADSIAVEPDYFGSTSPASYASAERLQEYHGNSVDEFQFVFAAGSASRTYTFDGQTTAAVTSVSGLQAALEGLSNVGAGNVQVHTHPGWWGVPADIMGIVKFKGDLAAADQPLLTASTGPAPLTIADGQVLVDEIQSIQITAAGGEVPFTFDGETTDPLDYPFTAAELETALEALSSGGAGNLTCSGNNPWLVEGTGDFALLDIPLITASVSALTGGKPIGVTTLVAALPGVNAVQRIVVDQFAYAGEILALFRGKLSVPVDYAASAATWQTALQGIFSIGSDNCSVDGTPANLLVEFTGDLAAQPLPLIELDQDALLVTPGLIEIRYTPAKGPNWFNVAANWSRGTVPSGLEAVIFSGGRGDLLYGLLQTAAVRVEDEYVTLIGGGDLVEGQWVRFRTDGTLPSATVGGDPLTLEAEQDYFVLSAELVDGENVVILSLTEHGLPIVFTDAGTGTHRLGLALYRLECWSRFTGAVGASQRDASGTWYDLPRFLAVWLADPDGTNPNFDVGSGDGQGSARLNFDLDDSYLDGRVLATGSGRTDPALCLLNDNLAQSRLLNITGEIGLGVDAGQLVRLNKLQSFGGRVTAARFRAKRVEDYVRSVNWITGQAAADVVELGNA